MLAVKRLVCVASLPGANKVAHSGSETQRRHRPHGGISGPIKSSAVKAIL